jgi:phosphoglucomutase
MNMPVHKLAGKPAPPEILEDIPKLIDCYYTVEPDPLDPEQKVRFGTSGHRGSSKRASFNQGHIVAVSQAICEFRKREGISGPLFLGMDTHALSEPAHRTAIQVLAANEVELRIAKDFGYTPTPAISHAIITYNQSQRQRKSDGIVITPSHNPPEDGGFKYNPPHGGPADTGVTRWIETRANEMMLENNRGVRKWDYEKALSAETTSFYDYVRPYVEDLKNVIDMQKIRTSGLKIGVDPMGGAALSYWDPIRELYGLNLEVVNTQVDPTFRFMRVDKDGRIRMDCSSPYAMAGLIDLKDRFDIAFGNDTDSDRHGIVTPTGGLMNPNHFLSVAVSYLFRHRQGWPAHAAIGKTLVSSGMIDRVADQLNRPLVEVPVGFKWFVGGLLNGEYGFGGEESAGAAFLRLNGSAWTTDKDGLILDLLAAEMTADTGRDPAEHYSELEERFGRPYYERIDEAATREQKEALKSLTPEQVTTSHMAGEQIVSKITRAPSNDAVIGGLKVSTKNGWFAARPSGTEEIYKVYSESFLSREHLRQIQDEARQIVSEAFKSAGV